MELSFFCSALLATFYVEFYCFPSLFFSHSSGEFIIVWKCIYCEGLLGSFSIFLLSSLLCFYVVRFMNFSSYFAERKNEENFLFNRFILHAMETRWADEVGLEVVFHDDCLNFMTLFYWTNLNLKSGNIFSISIQMMLQMEVLRHPREAGVDLLARVLPTPLFCRNW